MHIIGIELIDGKEHIIKNLKKKGDRLSDGSEFNGWYPFCRYNSNEKDPPTVNSSITFDIGYDFYKLDEKTDKLISVSCIVGKNGSGKSSLLELIYRIINNVGFCFQQITKFEGCDLRYEYGFKAKLYFSIFDEIHKEEKVGCFEINDEEKNYITFPNGNRVCLGNVEQKSEDDLNFYLEIENADNTINLKELESLFYSVVTNYSMYAFNPNDYGEIYYPYGIFHKNDAYTTPIVLLPYRNGEGVIDVENERGLAKQRIIALLIFLYKKYGVPMIENRIPIKISYKLSYRDETVSYNPYNEKLDQLNNVLKEKYGKEIIAIKPAESIAFIETSYGLYSNGLKETWKEKIRQHYNIDIEKLGINDEIKDKLLSYLIYKTVKICANYEFFLEKFDFSSTESAFANIINEIINDKSFITLKVRQCIEFFKNPLPINDNLDEQYYLNISYFDNTGMNIDDYFLKLPPAIFDTDLIFTDTKNEKSEIKMSSFSSGELQLLNSFSYVLYHIKNLECDKSELANNTEIKYPNYENIFIVFDEAELYMHPEYQRQFLYKLIDAIYKCNFERIKQIQILIATHSPYILSDVPVQNLLMLEEGEKRDNKIAEQTFGANIYDLLKNQFFMTAPVGEIARNKINEIIEFANSDNTSDDENQLGNYKCYVKNLGDSYLRNTLEYLLKNRKRRK